MIEGPLGKGRMILALAPGCRGAGAARCWPPRAAAAEGRRAAGARLPGWGTMALAACEEQAAALPGLDDRASSWPALLAESGRRPKPGRRSSDQPARRDGQRGAGRAVHAAARRRADRDLRASPGTSPTSSGSSTRATCTAAAGSTPWPSAATSPSTAEPCGSGRGSTTRPSTSRTCPRSSWTR